MRSLAHFRLIYDLCTNRQANYSKVLYEKYCESISEFLTQFVSARTSSSQTMQELHGLRGAPLLEKLDRHWQKYEIMLRWLKNFFAYLDRFFIKQESVEDLRTKGKRTLVLLS